MNYGPGEEGPKQRTPVTGDPNPFPKLYHWSDVVALEFAQFMTEKKKPTTNLKGVWQRQVINPDTQSLAAYLFGVGITKDMGKAGDWPGKDYLPDSDEFAALLASPNGVGVAYLLLQHRDLLGTKTITSIRVWRAEELHILFSIGDLSAVQRRSVVAGWEADSGSEGSRELLRPTGKQANETEISAFLPRAPSDNVPTVDQTKQAGAYFIDVQNTPTEQLESCKSIQQSTFTTIDQLSKSGWTAPVREAANVADTDIAVTQAWDAMNLDWKGDSITRINLKHTEKTVGADGKVYLPTQAFYKDWYCVGGIVADENESPWESGPMLRDNPVDGTDKPFPPLRQWSDAVFLEYQDVCSGDTTKMKALKGVLRKTVMNKPTVSVLRDYLGAQKLLRAGMFPQDWPGTVYKLGDEGFEVAMGVPGGKGVAYLLATHRVQLGWKEVYQVHIFADRSSFFNILYLIRDHAQGTDQSLRARHGLPRTIVAPSEVIACKQPRAAGLDYNTAQRKGLRVLCLTWNTVSTVAQSQWTDIRALSTYGWTQQDPNKRWDLRSSSDTDIAPALNDPAMRISTDPDDNFDITCYHDTDVTVGATMYPKTLGGYINIFNFKSGVIIARYNYGPDYEGRQRKPPVTGGAVTPLKQWSDIVFLLWQQHAGPDIKNLRYIFRWNIQNSDSKALLQQVLAKQKLDEPRAWPGTRLLMDSPDAQAILGSPNGLGVAYLLATHKEQLGFKVVYSVSIFATEDDYSLCFEILDQQDRGQVMNLPEVESEMTDLGAVDEPAETHGIKRSEYGVLEEGAKIEPREASGVKHSKGGGRQAGSTLIKKLSQRISGVWAGCAADMWGV